MLRQPKLLAAVLCVGLAASACASVDQDAIKAEQFSQATIDDPKIPIGPGSEITVEAFEWGFDVEGVAVDGAVKVNFVNIGGATHNFRIDNAAGDNKLVEAPGGETAEGELLLFGGATYTYYCDIPGHRGEGMEGEIVVYRDGEAPEDADTTVDEEAPEEAPAEDAEADAEEAPAEGEEAPAEESTEADG